MICSSADTSQRVLLKELKNDMLSNHHNLHDEFTDMRPVTLQPHRLRTPHEAQLVRGQN